MRLGTRAHTRVVAEAGNRDADRAPGRSNLFVRMRSTAFSPWMPASDAARSRPPRRVSSIHPAEYAAPDVELRLMTDTGGLLPRCRGGTRWRLQQDAVDAADTSVAGRFPDGYRSRYFSARRKSSNAELHHGAGVRAVGSVNHPRLRRRRQLALSAACHHGAFLRGAGKQRYRRSAQTRRGMLVSALHLRPQLVVNGSANAITSAPSSTASKSHPTTGLRLCRKTSNTRQEPGFVHRDQRKWAPRDAFR
jgi:hypothetical protein